MAFPDGWSGYYEIVSDYTKVLAVPGVVWIPLSTAPSAFWDALDASGDTTGRTIRVSSTSNALKPFYIAGINTSLRTGGLLFRDTSLSTSVNTTLRVWSGGAASMPAATDSEGRNACFAAFRSFHLIGNSLTDLTGNGFDMTASGSPGVAASNWEGITAASYAGTSDYHLCSSAPVSGWSITVEALGFCANATAAHTLAAQANSATGIGANIATLRARGDVGDAITFAVDGSSGNTATGTTSTSFSASTWFYAAGVHDTNNDDTHAYINGGSKGTTNAVVMGPSFNRYAIGVTPVSTPTNYLNGRVAAAYTSNVERSDNYITTMDNVWDNAVFTPGAWTATGGANTTNFFLTAA